MTALSDLRLAALERADRVNASTLTVAEMNRLINASAAGLYRIIGQLYEDYNVASYPFTLAGGVGIGNNMLQVGTGSGVPAFDKIRYLSRVVQAAGSGGVPVNAPVLRADSPMEFDSLTSPVLTPYFGTALTQRVKYWLWGSTLEVRPALSAGASYLLYYIPSFQPLVLDTDTIDGTWMATNGASEYIVLDVAAKVLIKEESLDTAQLLLTDRERIKQEILQQFAQRDDNQPGRIVDAKRARRGLGFGTDWR